MPWRDRQAAAYNGAVWIVTEFPMKYRALLVLALFATTPILLPARQTAEPTIKLEKGIQYATAGGEKLQLDIAIPPGEGPFPCVVCLHGGAWMGGSRRDLSGNGKDKSGKPTPSWIEVIAEHGYVTASVSYRLAPKCKFPAMIEDARAAVRFLRANAKTYRADPDKFAAFGFSAGGHLALLLGLAPNRSGSTWARTRVSGRCSKLSISSARPTLALCQK